MKNSRCLAVALALVAALLCGCGGGEPAHGGAPGGAGHSKGRPGAGPPGGAAPAAVPVEAAPVARRSISSFIETNGTLAAENEVDVVARTAGPIVELLVEEGDRVRRGQRLARLDDLDYRAQFEISRVNLEETRLAFERAQSLQAEKLISAESFEQARSAFETATAQLEANRILLDYTEIKAPFDGLIVSRYVQFAQQVSANTPMFRISDFDPLLCPIQVPERDLARLRVRQRAYVTVESYPDRRFPAEVLRISPVIDAATGTIKVTLDVDAEGQLLPGMFARVFVEVDRRPNALVIPKAALSLDSIGDTVYVAADSVASRRVVELGFREGDYVEVLSGLQAGESIVVVGQDGLSDGTPLDLLTEGDAPEEAQEPQPEHRGNRPNLAEMTPEQLEGMKERMRSKGMSDEQINERIERMRERAGAQ